jgi:hypothetical protein
MGDVESAIQYPIVAIGKAPIGAKEHYQNVLANYQEAE